MKKRIFALLTLLALLLCIVCGCASDTDNVDSVTESSTVTEGESETDRIPYDTNGLNYGGYTFRVLNYSNVLDNGWSDIPNDLNVEAENGDLLNDSVYNRNKKVEDNLNIEISCRDLGHNDLSNAISKSVMSGSDDFDAAFPRMYLFQQLANSELLLDLNSIDAFDFSQPWWNQNSVECLTILGKLFGVASDITFQDKLSTYVTFFNHQLAEDYGLGDLYSLVENNEWTLDKLLQLGENASHDIDNNGIYDDRDSYGLSCQNDGVYILLHAANLRICKQDSDGKIVFALTEEKAVNTLQKIYSVVLDSRRYFNRQTFNLTLNDAVNMFNDNRTLFLIRPIQSLFLMRNMQSDFGILPLPKLDINQSSYGSAVNPYSATLLCIPLSVFDAERSAEILQYLAYESHYTVIGPLYETVLGTKLIRDESSVKMLDITFGSSIYDIGLIWDFAGIVETIMLNKDTNVASMLAANESAVIQAIENLNEIVAKK